MLKSQLIKVVVPSPSSAVSFSGNLLKTYESLVGISVSHPSEPSVYSSSLNLFINEGEVFPDDFPVQKLTYSQDCPINGRTENWNGKMNIPARGATIRGKYTDGGVEDGVTFPHTVIIELLLEDKNETLDQ